MSAMGLSCLAAQEEVFPDLAERGAKFGFEALVLHRGCVQPEYAL